MSNDKELWFEETENIFQELLKQVAVNLNKVHSVNFSARFWDIFLGAWLREFVELVVLQIFEYRKGQKSPTSKHEIPPINSLATYRNLSKKSSFVEALRNDTWEKIEDLDKEFRFQLRTSVSKTPISRKTSLGRTYLSATYLSRFQDAALRIWFGRLPSKLSIVEPPIALVNRSYRESIGVSNWDISEKSKVILSLLPRYLPCTYLESFGLLDATRKPWRGKRFPRVIFTANRHLYDDVFNYWTARAVEHGSKLVLAQHGGYYGISEFPSGFERHEIDIADRYISWGWSSSKNSVLGPALVLVGQEPIKRSYHRSLIIVTDQLFTYPRSLFGDINEASHYLWNIQTLITSIEKQIESILIRIPLTHDQSGHSQIDWFNTHLPQISIDTGERKFRDLLKDAELVVIPHNGTTLIESIALGIPTIIFWDRSIVWMRPEAEPVFQLMERAGIFHSTPESAAAFINQIWDDVDGWWNSPQVVDARSEFCNQYARTVPHPVRFLVRALKF
jgi:putative transferase (TIGR04331 family)